MKFQITLVRLGAVGFDLFGLAYFFMPQQMSGLLGIQLTQPSAFGDVRAVYGGLAFGVAVFLWLCGNPIHARMGAKLLLLMGIGLVSGRILSIVINGAPNAAALVLLSIEVSMTLVSIFALRTPAETTQLQTA